MRAPTTIERAAHLAAAAYLIKHSHESTLVVVDDYTDEPVAVITDADVARAAAHGWSLDDTRICEVVTARPLTVRADAVTAEAARLMLAKGLRCLPVVDDERLVGVVELLICIG